VEELIAITIFMALFGAITRRIFDTAHARGDVDITVIAEDGTIIDKIEYRNLIVDVGKTLLAKRLAGDASYASEHIGKIAFGTSNTAAAAGQTSLVAEVLSKETTASYPAYNQVKFSATMESNEGGSSTYQELGLKSATSNILFSRVVISPITKSAAYKILVEWTISIQ
jgi:hypothetical protein